MPATALPNLSDVRAFTGDYLTDAAQYWSDSAQRWTETYERLAREVLYPGGRTWTGEAAEAAALRVGTDRVRVLGVADDLHAVAATARRAAADLHATRTSLLNTVNAAEAAGFTVGEDFSLTSLETGSSAEMAAREAQARSFAATIRADVLALVSADERTAAQIASAATGLQSLGFGSFKDTGSVQATGFHGLPVPQKPPNPPPIPPPEGWSQDPLMRAAQKIAYGHASNAKTGHMGDFPGMTKAQLAELVYQKMQRAMTDPSGLVLGGSDTDGVPVIYDPKDNILIVRDTRPNAPDGGTVFKPDLEKDPSFATKKFGSYTSIFTPDQLADGPVAPASPPSLPESSHGSVDTAARGDESPAAGSFPDWGTHISPEEAAKSDGALGILGKIMLGQLPPDPNDPANNT